ncbi:MAG TPA: NADH:ubiquinone reductase (Na(+)-transporting) subunit B [Candidatus Hydrogenedentes bacterium]|nr:NADH:ubiquinone reductase (Na(+)-transporting) subunit B [Candidatus Hydrogenedentota bacterium]
MSVLRKLMDKPAKLFEKGGRLEKLYPLWEAIDTFTFTPGQVTRTASHVRDGLDLKRLMITVVVALVPCTLMAMYNTGLQANLALEQADLGQLTGWRNAVMHAVGFGYNPGSFLACLFHGALYFLPVYIVTVAIGGAWETLFAVVRKHEINEGFLVTSLLFPLILPPTIPLWQVAVGISFGVVIGKEIFGGVGMNVLNPALTARAFLYFAYPAQISGDKVWTAVDGYSGATALAVIKESGLGTIAPSGLFDWNLGDGKLSWIESFIGIEPGSMGETSTLFCLFGAAVLIATGVGSWRTMAGILVGAFVCATGLSLVESSANPAFALPFHWHLVIGGLAFGAVFMATDPVTSPFTDTGKWVYGLLIGLLIILMRVVNPAYPETVMLVILLMNVFAPLIDYFVIQANVKRRAARYAA